MGADIDEQPAGLVEDELLERMRALVEPGAIGQRDAAARHVADDGLDRAARIVRERVEPEDGLGGRGVELLVRTDHKPERIFDTRQQLLEPLAWGRVRIEQQQPPVGMAPTAHVCDHEEIMAGHLDDRARKFQMVLFAGDKAGAKSRLHVDLDFGKSEIAAAAGLSSDGVAALAHRFR